MNSVRWAALIVVVLFASFAAKSQTQTPPQPSSAALSVMGDWPTTSAAETGLSESRLRILDTAIRSGEFKKIGSVLIARHGKLAYEAYFDGDAATPRDTRSATKSITDALIGIAIDFR
jgi:hypothetical protein